MLSSIQLPPNNHGMGAIGLPPKPGISMQIQSAGRELLFSVPNLILFINDPYYKNIKNGLKFLSINLDEVSSINELSNAFFHNLSRDCDMLKEINILKNPSLKKDLTIDEANMGFLDIFSRMTENVKNYFISSSECMNKCLTALSTIKLQSGDIKDDSNRELRNEMETIVPLIQLVKKDFDKIENLMKSKAQLCLTTLNKYKSNFSEEDQSKIQTIFQSQFCKPNFKQALEILKVASSQDELEATTCQSNPFSLDDYFDLNDDLSIKIPQEIITDIELLLKNSEDLRKRKADHSLSGGINKQPNKSDL